MPKLTWKEAILNHLKDIIKTEQLVSPNVFTFKQLFARIDLIKFDVQSQSKAPERTIDKTLKELRDLKILIFRADLGPRKYEYVPNSDNEHLIYKDKRSMGHIRVTKCLDNLGLMYEEEKTFNDLKHKSFLRFDIYLILFNHCKIAIEYDGSQHAKAVDMWGGQVGLEEGQERDIVKDNYCNDNGIALLRISHNVKDIEGYTYTFLKKISVVYLIIVELMAVWYYLKINA